MYQCLMHNLADGLDSIGEGIGCITLILFHAYRNSHISREMWNLLPKVLSVCADGASYGLEYIQYISLALKNYIARDPVGLVKVVDETSYLIQICDFLERCFQIERITKNDKLDSIYIVNIIIALFENIPANKLNNHGILDKLLNFLMTELDCESKCGE